MKEKRLAIGQEIGRVAVSLRVGAMTAAGVARWSRG